MKILYVMVRIESSTGVLKKIKNQIDQLIEQGIDVALAVGFGDVATVAAKGNLDDIFKGLKIFYCNYNYSHRINTINKLMYLSFFYKKLKLISIIYQPDFYYYRGLTAEPNLAYFVKKNKKKIIFEINSIIKEEYRLKKSYGKLFLNYIYMKRVLKNAAGCITVTNEIAQSIRKVVGKKTIIKNISNGVDVNSFPIISERIKKEKEINLIFVGHIAKWHGLDRIIKGIADYDGEYLVNLHVVGPKCSINPYKYLVSNYSIEKNIIFHGELHGERLNKIFDICDVAVTSLGMHRINLHEGSVLKTREYLARGIPIMLGYYDIDLSNERLPFTLHVPADESNIDINILIDFYKTLFENDDYRNTIRSFAKKKVDVKEKVKELVKFLHNLEILR